MSLFFPTELTKVNAHISVMRIEDTVYYYKDNDLTFIHEANDKVAFRFLACQLCITHLAKQTEIGKVFKISKKSLIRWINGYKKMGASFFYTIGKKDVRAREMRKKRTLARIQKPKMENIIGVRSSAKEVKRKIYP